MNKRIFPVFLAILIMIISNKSFSQDQNAQTKTQVKPALLIIDIQNAFLNIVPEREKEVALYNINIYIELFRSYGYPVIRIYHFSEEYGPQQGTDQFEFHGILKQINNHKFNSPEFEGIKNSYH